MSTRTWLLVHGILMTSYLAAPCLGDEGLTPLEQLEQQGLVKEKGYFILPIETPLRAKMINLRPTMGEMAQKFGVWAAIVGNENELQYFTELRINLIAQINDVGQQISQLSSREEFQKLERARLQQYRGELDNNLKECNSELALRQSRLVPPRRKDKAEEDFKDVRKVFLEKSGEIGQDYTAVKEAYLPILDDSALKASLKAYNQQTRANLKFGPSEALKKGIGTILKYEQDYSPETALASAVKGNKKKTKKSNGKVSPLRSRPAGTVVPKGAATSRRDSGAVPPQPRPADEESQGFVPDR